MKVTAMLTLLFLIGCANDPDSQPCDVAIGQMVQVKLDGRTGMVIRKFAHHADVWVRFPAVQITTDTHTLGADGPVVIGPYADVYMRCFELQVGKVER